MRSPGLVCVESLIATRHVQQQLGRFESSRKARVEVFEPLHHDLYAQAVPVTEWAATEGRKADPEYRAYIAGARRARDSIVQTTSGLVQHGEDRALLNLHGRH